MNTERIPTFDDFWHETRRPYIRFCLTMAVYLPLAILAGMFAARALQCYLHVDNIVAVACADLWHPRGMFDRWLHLLPEIYLLIPVVLLAALYLEWDKYRKDEPSYFTHGTFWCQSKPWVDFWKKQFSELTIRLGEAALEAVEVAPGHRLVRGDFSEKEVLAYSRKLAGWWNKPKESMAEHTRWQILIRNGDEVHIHLHRHPGETTTWTLRTESYQWAGRKSPPTLVETHITEFVPLS
ncbi:MAG: hypothetical protein U1C04_14950 [Hydrogenophaga sp.]|uniref:hypothetical protein n=1 Tax=Hydrogenophaga sp. TaxID=1904254 RepID=UPI002ABB6CF6|nr:hypothetical protein [Hydrogenophaga sp.]MDZ4282053.1 hypothetical protein [Hydrogenophaga sp.]